MPTINKIFQSTVHNPQLLSFYTAPANTILHAKDLDYQEDPSKKMGYKLGVGLSKLSLKKKFSVAISNLFYLTLFILLPTQSITYPKKHFTIMLNPAKTNNHAERIIDSSFERSISLSTLETIKTKLEERMPHIAIIIATLPHTMARDTTSQQEHIAHFANSLQVNLFLELSFYQETDIKQQLYIYQFSYNNDLIVRPSEFVFYRYDQSYIFNQRSSLKVARIFEQLFLSPPYSNHFHTHSIIGFPSAALIGITCPAINIEIGIKKRQDALLCIEPIVESIMRLIKETEQS